ncbi:hypothetical protein E5T96_21955 [Vibrio vulnificus]|nr:hypothetical protein [Vibrio vulnificus]EGR0642024.1 hypothetical protein [Vibrio vulnificus]EGR0651340.1 hypothetical protein [Vibrio vulnificus]
MKTINLRLFKNPFRPSQLAENTERILNEIVALTLKTHQTHNAQLRGEQRLPQNLRHCAINTKFEVEAKVPSVENPS